MPKWELTEFQILCRSKGFDNGTLGKEIVRELGYPIKTEKQTARMIQSWYSHAKSPSPAELDALSKILEVPRDQLFQYFTFDKPFLRWGKPKEWIAGEILSFRPEDLNLLAQNQSLRRAVELHVEKLCREFREFLGE